MDNPTNERLAMSPTLEAQYTGTNDAGESTDLSIDETLAQRGTRYGSFTDHAAISQRLQQTFYQHMVTHQSEPIPPYMVEAINMIFHKLARIANGDPYYDDNWRDLSGYSKLVVDILNGKNT